MEDILQPVLDNVVPEQSSNKPARQLVADDVLHQGALLLRCQPVDMLEVCVGPQLLLIRHLL